MRNLWKETRLDAGTGTNNFCGWTWPKDKHGKSFALVCLILLVAYSLLAQGVRVPGPGGIAAPAFTIIAHTSAYSRLSSFSTTGQDTTGSNICWATVAQYMDDGHYIAITDNKSNTWTRVSTTYTADAANAATFYVKAPAVGSNHIITVTGGAYTAVAFVCANGAISAGGADQSSDVRVEGTDSIQGTSVTPSNTNQIVISAIGTALNASYPSTANVSSINGGFTILEQVNPGGSSPGPNSGVAFAYLIQTTAAAANPTWTMTGIPYGGGVVVNTTWKSH